MTRSSFLDLENLKNNRSLAVLFQPNCSICTRQVKNLKCLEDDREILLLGAYASEAALRKEYIHLRTKYPGYLIDESGLQYLGLTQRRTPITVFFHNQKANYLVGFQSCQKIRTSLGI